MSSHIWGVERPRPRYPQVIDMTLTSGLAPAHLDVVGGSPELADDARFRLFELERLWLDDDAEGGLACLQVPSRQAIAVAPETLLLLALAETLSSEGGGCVPPRLDFEAMTVSLDTPMPATVLSALRSWSSGLMVDLVMADVIDGGAWGAFVAVGGVARTFGIAGDGRGWTLTVLAPDGLTRVIELGDGAIASSTQPPTALRMPPGVAADRADQRDDITWAAVQADMAWQAQAMADGLVGLTEESALDRLRGAAETALLYRRDGQLREISNV